MLHPCIHHEDCKGWAVSHETECIECQEARKQHDEEQRIKRLHKTLTTKPTHFDVSKGIAE